MDDAYDVPDSTDWINTPLKDFAALENALHCQICKEFYDTPMITSCNHTFCSKCIRTSLSTDGKCPACRASDQANKLRNNWAVQEVVSTFREARPAALAVARKAQEEEEEAPRRPNKRKRTTVPEADDVEDVDAEASSRTTRSKSRRIAASQGSQADPMEISDSDEDNQEIMPDKPEPTPSDGLIECPLGCGKRMKEAEVFGHLDRCEDEKKQAARARSRTQLNGFAISRTASNQSTRPQDRINELNYSMMKETALTKKLKEQGLPSFGTKQLMVTRHKEWVNIWNANCDSDHPRSRRELLRDLDVWERTQGGKAPSVNGLSSTIMRKDFDGDAYARRHQDEFTRLIRDAKRKKNIPQSQQSASKNTSAEDETPGEPPVISLISENSGDLRPYENDPSALTSVREKVEAINRGEDIHPVVNEGFKIPATPTEGNQTSKEDGPSMFNNVIEPASIPPSSQTMSPPESSPPGLSSLTDASHELQRQNSNDEHVVNGNTGSPCNIPAHLNLDSPGKSRKVPMFEVPSQPVSDVDGAGVGS